MVRNQIIKLKYDTTIFTRLTSAILISIQIANSAIDLQKVEYQHWGADPHQIVR